MSRPADRPPHKRPIRDITDIDTQQDAQPAKRHHGGGGSKTGQAEDDLDDLSFLLEVRRRSGEVTELPRRITRAERLSRLVKGRGPAGSGGEWAVEEDVDTDEEAKEEEVAGRNPQPEESIWTALERKDFDLLKQNIEYNPTCIYDREGEEGWVSPLGVAMEERWARAVKFLVKHGAPLTNIDSQGWSCLHYAVRDYDELPKNLLPHLLRHTSVPINQPGNDGTYPIHLVESEKALKWLLAYGADPTVSCRYHCWPRDSPQTVSDIVKHVWPSDEKRKQRRALAMLRRAPYQAYQLEKAKYILETESAMARLEDTVIEARVQGKLVGVDDAVADEYRQEAVCWEEVPGQVYSLERRGQLYLVRLDHPGAYSREELGLGEGAAVPLRSLLEAGAEEFDYRGMRSPSSIGTSEDAHAATTATGSISGGSSVTGSPMRVDPPGEVADDEASESEADMKKKGEDEPWVLLPSFPRVDFHTSWEESQPGQGSCSASASASTLPAAAVVYNEALTRLSQELWVDLLSYLW